MLGDLLSEVRVLKGSHLGAEMTQSPTSDPGMVWHRSYRMEIRHSSALFPLTYRNKHPAFLILLITLGWV